MSDAGSRTETGHAKTGHAKTAGIVSRAIAAIVDLMVVGTILGSGYLSVALLILMINVRDFSFPRPHIIFTATGFIVVSIVYLTGCWAVTGRTIGAVLMGLRVVSHADKSLRPSGAFLRALICTFFAVGLLWSAIDSRRRSIADILLRSRVVYSR